MRSSFKTTMMVWLDWGQRKHYKIRTPQGESPQHGRDDEVKYRSKQQQQPTRVVARRMMFKGLITVKLHNKCHHHHDHHQQPASRVSSLFCDWPGLVGSGEWRLPAGGDAMPAALTAAAAAAVLAAYRLASSWALPIFFLYLIRLLPNQFDT